MRKLLGRLSGIELTAKNAARPERKVSVVCKRFSSNVLRNKGEKDEHPFTVPNIMAFNPALAAILHDPIQSISVLPFKHRESLTDFVKYALTKFLQEITSGLTHRESLPMLKINGVHPLIQSAIVVQIYDLTHPKLARKFSQKKLHHTHKVEFVGAERFPAVAALEVDSPVPHDDTLPEEEMAA